MQIMTGSAESGDDAGDISEGVLPDETSQARSERLDAAFADLDSRDRLGRAITYSDYRRPRADQSYRPISHDRVGHVEVVTMWLGRNQGEGDRLESPAPQRTAPPPQPPAGWALMPETASTEAWTKTRNCSQQRRLQL